MSKAMLLYSDLEIEIEALERQLHYTEQEYKNIFNKSIIKKPSGLGAIDYTADRVTGGLMQMPADRAVERMNQLIERHNEIEKELEEKYQFQKEMKEHLSKLEGLEKQVAYKRIVEGKDLKTIAAELGYSYQYIRRLNMQHIGNKKIEKVCYDGSK